MTNLKPKISKTIRFLLDECIPPVIRDRKWFYGMVIRLWNKNMDIDFKRKAFYMTDEEFCNAYEKLVPMRSTDMTVASMDFVLNNLTGDTVLEVGCGNGNISIAASEKGFQVTASDLASGNLQQLKNKIAGRSLNITTQVANVEQLPFADKSFDTTLCLHTLEHVVNLPQAIAELKRVTKKRVIVIVPKQRYYKYTCDYHLNFFGGAEQLILAMKIKNTQCKVIDNCLCYIGDLS